MDRAQRSLSHKRHYDRTQLKNQLIIKELSNETRPEMPVKHDMPTFQSQFSLTKRLDDIAQAHHVQPLSTEQRFKKIKELAKDNAHEINRMMDFLALQKAEHKKYKEKEAREIENARERHDHQLRKNMTDCYPKHPAVFQKRIHKQGLFEETKFMPQECPPPKTKQNMETKRKEQDKMIMSKPWNYVSRTGEQLDLNRYDAEHHVLTRQTAVGVEIKQKKRETEEESKWKYFQKHTKEYFEVPAPEFIDPKVQDFKREKNGWKTNDMHGGVFDKAIYS